MYNFTSHRPAKKEEPFLFSQSKAISSQFLSCPQFSKVSAEHTEADRQQAFFFFFLSFFACTEIKQDIQQKTKADA